VVKDNKTSDLIERIINLIKFGIYETAISEIKQELKVVSIVGR
jgi:hypothetical protein